MKGLAWFLVLAGAALAAATAFVVSCSPGLSVLAGVLSGAAFSAFFSLFMGRLIHLETMLTELLADTKAWDSRDSAQRQALAHKFQIRLELLTDIGYRARCPVVSELKPMPEKIRGGCNQSEAAAPLYSLLQRNPVPMVACSMFFAQYPHKRK